MSAISVILSITARTGELTRKKGIIILKTNTGKKYVSGTDKFFNIERSNEKSVSL